MATEINRADLQTAAKIVTARRSVRRYRREDVPAELIDELLRYAVSAPSAHNRQPWRFAVIRDERAKARLAEAMGARLREDRLRDGDPSGAVEADVARSFERITHAPVVVLVAATTADMDRYPDASRSDAEYLMAVQSTAMAVQNLLVLVQAAGLAASWMCAPLFCQETARAAAGLPADWRPQALVTIGFAASAGKPYSRRPLEQVVRHLERT